jgi:hypothetical protein
MEGGMSAFVLITGALFRAPEQKVAKSGNPYVISTIKAKDGDGFQFWRVTAFSESAQAELLRLSEGDAISAQGALQASVYTPPGKEPRVNLSVVANAILPLKPPPRERKPKAAPPATAVAPDRSPLARHAGDGVDEFGDDIPF